MKYLLQRVAWFTGIVLFLFFTQGCVDKTVFDDTKDIENSVWKTDEKLVFEYTIADSLYLYDFYLKVRHNTNYKYSNLYLFIDTRLPDGQWGRDTVELVLADKSGKWLGKGIGRMRDVQVLLKGAVRLPMRGEYRFELEQAMRDEELEGISGVGILINKI